MIGLPIDRIDGPRKVTGTATYAYEEYGLGQPLYGVMVGATVGHGRVARIDTRRAQQSPGVRLVMTQFDAPAQRTPDLAVDNQYARAYPVLQGHEVSSYGMPVALVVAATLEQAQAAAGLVEVEYARAIGHYELAAHIDRAFVPKSVNGWMATDSKVGDFDVGFASAAVTIDATYTTPYHFAQPMEPHACLAAWNGDTVTVHVSSQIVACARIAIAETLGIAHDRVKVFSRFVGGGFGSKLGIHAETILAVLAARKLRRPVKVMTLRQQIPHVVGHRPASIQRVRLGADRDGRLSAFGHDVVMQTSRGSDYIEQTATVGRALYAAPNRTTTHRGVELDLMRGEDVRAPGEAPGLLAVESAMDELAHQLGMDPVELRILNEPAQHPETGQPFGGRRLVECLREGAKRFGWASGARTPRRRREGRWLIGHGMAAMIRPHFQMATEARVRLGMDGIAVVQSDMTDIGTGTYTILAQIAAETLGLPIERVRVELGDADLPVSAGSGGSWGATNSTSAVYAACRALIAKAGATSLVELPAIVARDFPEGIEATGSIASAADDPNYKTYSHSTYGATFAEVQVDVDTGEIRVRRMLGVFAAGRIFNHKTARSQLIGGMLWGLGEALLEEGVVDRRSGAFVNRDLASYLVPAHADVRDVDAIILDDFDDKANALGAKGVGELGICGSGAAIANAVFDATGIRVRDFPITLEKVLADLPLQ